MHPCNETNYLTTRISDNVLGLFYSFIKILKLTEMHADDLLWLLLTVKPDRHREYQSNIMYHMRNSRAAATDGSLQIPFCTCKSTYKFLHVLARGCFIKKTFGVQCSRSMCFVYSPAACQCNGHSQCINESVCEKCEDLTTGRHCESCISGFYGDPTNGGSCQREYPWAAQPSTKSTSQSLCAQLNLTCQWFTLQFYACHFPWFLDAQHSGPVGY